MTTFLRLFVRRQSDVTAWDWFDPASSARPRRACRRSRSRNRVIDRATRRSSDETTMIRKLPSGQYRLYSRKKNPKTGRRRNLGTFKTRAAAMKHEREVQGFKRRG